MFYKQRVNATNIKYTLSLIVVIFSISVICAVENTNSDTSEEIEAISDSLRILREESIAKETGVRENDTLQEAATKLEVPEIGFQSWKSFLGLEAKNEQINSKTMKELGISLYQAELAKQTLLYDIHEANTLLEIAAIKKVPVKKLKALLDLDPLDKNLDQYSIQVHGYPPEVVSKICDEFQDKTVLYGSSITLVGMLIVFSSLALISLIVSQLVRIDQKTLPKDTKIKITKSGILKAAPKDINRDTIVAAITALHLHVHQIEERRRLLLTFKRAPLNLWHSTNVISMPNLNFQASRRKK